MTAPLPIDATTHTVKVRLSLAPPHASVVKTFDVPLERFSIYRTAYLTAEVVDALEEKTFGIDHAIVIDARLPTGMTIADADCVMELVGLVPLASAEPTLTEVVRLWPALALFGARHAVDRCHEALVRDISLDHADSILAVYLFDVMCAQWSLRCGFGRANVLAPLMPTGGSDAAARTTGSAQSIIDYMTLRDRLVDLGMAIESETLSSQDKVSLSPRDDGDDDECVERRRAMVAMTNKNRSNVQKAVAEALRDWALPLHAVDQVFATDFSMARPLTDAGARWLMTGDVAASTIPFEQNIRDLCPAFANVLLGKSGILAAGDVVMAGGAVVNATQRPKDRCSLPGSDIDLWIVGANHAARTLAFERTIRVLFDAVPGCYATVSGSVVTVHAPTHVTTTGTRLSAPVQVILTPYRSASQIVCGFDMSHACAYTMTAPTSMPPGRACARA
ncbi:hypothetical protein psal_cds_34 [Pandoravirus salinus]|uniref:Uncharacterized protein n=1 Tax=Pandoravirus salinus TaxID=1349410 RepID=S4VSY2_9VIRU|nr:hypothetical protein psal_cds_34 [Pandoravirus salinus]AGO83408.1 hypothetical protein psal_cds_34 [Pandoravirus salinus]